jgi:nicotinamidase-related amidase
MTTALLIIDVQHALCSGPYEAFDAAGVIDRINAVSRRAREVGAPVVVIQHEAAGGPLAHGSPGWQLAQGLETAEGDILLRKQATDSFHQTALQAMLQARGVHDLVICGLQSEFCVDTTTRRALALGYPVTLVADGHSTMDNGVLSAAQIAAHHNVTLAHITSFGPRARAVAAADVVQQLGRDTGAAV